MRISRSRFASLLPAAPALCPSALPAVAAVEPKTAGEILDYIDDLFRGESSQARLSMHVKTGHWERSLELEAWSKGKERSLIRILAAIALLDARSAQIQPSVTWSASDNVEVVGGAVVGIGERPAVAPAPVLRSEFGTFADFSFLEVKAYL